MFDSTSLGGHTPRPGDIDQDTVMSIATKRGLIATAASYIVVGAGTYFANERYPAFRNRLSISAKVSFPLVRFKTMSSSTCLICKLDGRDVHGIINNGVKYV